MEAALPARPAMSKSLIIGNFVLFQLGWFACVLGGAYQLPWLGVAALLVFGGIHLYLVQRPMPELKLMLAAMAIGLPWDSLLVALGWLAYPSGQPVDVLAPYWIVAMWGLFATTINVSLGWLKRSYSLAAVFGAVGGPLAYWSGQKLGGVILLEPVEALIALGVGWAIWMPALVWIARRWDGTQGGEAS